jgi:serine/threonine-protein kinase ULK/ATG1
MEYCSGGDLAAFVKSRRGLREPLARRFLQQMAFALMYLRENNISHMDLKPHNLLLNTVARTMVKIGGE